MQPILKALLKSVFLLLSVPLFYRLAFSIAQLFHEPKGNTSDIPYGITLFFLQIILVISIPVLVLLQEFVIKKEKTMLLLHLGWFACICWFTIGTLEYRPFRFGLLLACIGSTLITRIILNRVIR